MRPTPLVLAPPRAGAAEGRGTEKHADGATGTGAGADADAGAGRQLHLGRDFVGLLHRAGHQVEFRLGHEIDRAERERPHGRFATLLRQRRDHHHRHRLVFHQPVQERQAVHARHFDVEGQHVRFELGDLVPGDVGVLGSADDLDFRVFLQKIGQNCPHEHRIIDDQDTRSCSHVRLPCSEQLDVTAGFLRDTGGDFLRVL